MRIVLFYIYVLYTFQAAQITGRDAQDNSFVDWADKIGDRFHNHEPCFRLMSHIIPTSSEQARKRLNKA